MTMLPVLYLQVLSVDCITEAGFSRLVAVVEGLEDYAGALVKIYAKNENYIARELERSGTKLVEGVVLACTPDLICVIDSDTGEYDSTIHHEDHCASHWIQAHPL